MDNRPTWSFYRAPCISVTTGCRQCGKEIPPRRAYCSVECNEIFGRNHFWNSASAHAIFIARPFGPAPESHRQPWFGPPVCARCGKWCDGVYGVHEAREAEVNHKVPLNGKRPSFGCCHHQENLEVVCHGCHVVIGKEQRAAGLIDARHRAASAVSAAESTACVLFGLGSLNLV